ncbi:hypothetical protein ACU61A_41075 [Pseudonocardia sichuanensis]
MEVLAVCLVLGWFVRAAIEDILAEVRGRESPRVARQRARQEMARTSGVPTIGQAATARIATLLAPRPAGHLPQRRHPALEYLRTRWEDAWDELLESHNEEMRRRAEARRDRKAQEAERKRREREGAGGGPYDDDIIDADIVEDEPPARCAVCRLSTDEVGPLDEFGECPACQAYVRDNLAAQERLADLDDEQIDRLNEPAGWRETTGGAERTGGDFHEDQDGDAYYRRWEQPHPSGDGTLRTTVTSWAQDDGTRRWIVTDTEWDWIGDNPSDLRFEAYDQSYSAEDGPSGQPWPTAEDVRSTVDDIQQPADPTDTPFADVLDATPCAGGCGTWVVDGMCIECENRRALPPAPETPEPDQGPASTTQDSTDSGPAAHQEGTPVPQTTVINPDILDATGALRCAEGSTAFTGAVRRQMEKLAANAQAGLRGDVPAVQEIRAFEAGIAASVGKLHALVEEHVAHVRTQAELAGDANLKTAAVGYLDSRRRA